MSSSPYCLPCYDILQNRLVSGGAGEAARRAKDVSRNRVKPKDNGRKEWETSRAHGAGNQEARGGTLAE